MTRARLRLAGIAVAAIGVLALVTPHAAGSTDARPEIWTVSTKPQLVSGGDARVRVRTTGDEPRVLLNGRDVSARFERSSEREFTGLLTGLRDGTNTVTASSRTGRDTLTVTNWPSSGPIISGPHSKPFYCQTEEAGLGPAADADCRVKPKVSYWYWSQAAPPTAALDGLVLDMASSEGASGAFGVGGGGSGPTGSFFRPLTDPAGPYPADVAQTTTSAGRRVPFIVRVESGVIDRGVYQIAILDDPHQRKPGETYQPTAGWNRNVVFQFGGGCSAGAHVSGKAAPGNVLHEPFLRRGHAMAMNTLNMLSISCNDVVSAEALMMTKEHFVDRYAPIRHTIGMGVSGGSIQQQMIATQYPGLLDGLLPSLSFPDLWSSLARPVWDCFLLDRAFAGAPQAWTQDKKLAVTGMSLTGCESWNAIFNNTVAGNLLPPPPGGPIGGALGREAPRADVRGGCDAAIPREKVYDAESNPKGIRCTPQDAQATILGRDPETGFAYRPYDNVGVQYGLQALNAGKISKREFLDVNARVGGYDIDGNPTKARTRMKAPPSVVTSWYEQGRVTSGGGGLPEVPIIDRNLWVNDFEVHHTVFSHMTRERLQASAGTFDNQVLWVGPAGAQSAIDAMQQWLDNIDNDGGPASRAAKVLRNRPADVRDSCAPQAMPALDPSTCGTLFPQHSTPQLVAGAPATQDVLQCRLKPLERSDYRVRFTSGEWQRLKTIFSSGVCDWRRPGVGQVPLASTWTSYGPAR